ncbi:RsmD family RNA methyltransferase [Thermotoga sp. RQ7]|uniref:RsmD family RNA methyltransferase n=1 Tax=Thermotoga sp. RQ7 TaxID=126738 RepID=UPI001F352A4E|nr:RsmD family RNA methyltransferase [Thermotoga sp. RQ7]
MKTGDFFRPTMSSVRSALFNMVDVEGKSFLELFCGSCVVSCEALSRGADRVVCVDKSKRALKICKGNLETIGGSAKLICKDVVDYLKTATEKFDIIFLDPPYEDVEVIEKTLHLLPKVMKEESLAILEKSKRIDVDLSGFEIVKKKDYGETELVFLKVKE